jgi:aspartate carbamoyltransferase regulatory subunit
MNDNKKPALQVSALCNGTVIDHIPADKLFAVVNLLDIPSMGSNVTIGYNLESKKLG